MGQHDGVAPTLPSKAAQLKYLYTKTQHREQARGVRSPCIVLETYDLMATAEMWHVGQCIIECRDGQLQDIQECQDTDVRNNMGGKVLSSSEAGFKFKYSPP